MASWDRQEKEPQRAYQHFTVYRDLGPERTLNKASGITGVKESALQQESCGWNWTARCDQWDAHVQAIHDRAFLTESAKRGKQRAQAFTALLGKSLEALRNLDTSKATLGQIAAAVETAAKGLRLEEGLETSRVSMEVTDARVILSRLPAEVRSGLLRALSREVTPSLTSGDPINCGGGHAELEGD